MELSQNPHKDTVHDITSIMAILAHADTTITPKIMAGINTLASTQETHQDDTEIMHQARVRLSTATAEDIERILSFLHTLKDSQANFPNKISLI